MDTIVERDPQHHSEESATSSKEMTHAARRDHYVDSRWWPARRAADYVGAGPKEIYKAVRAGHLKAVRLNRRGDIRTLREWVDEWMEQKQRDQRVI